MLPITFTLTSSDRRIFCAQLFITIAFLGSLFGILTTNLKPDDQLILILMLSIFILLNFVGFAFLRHTTSASLVFALLTTYIWVAYPVQLLITLHNPQSATFLVKFLRPEVIQYEITAAFYSVFPGIIALLTGLLIGRKKFTNNVSNGIYALRHHLFIITIVGIMLLKILIQTYLGIGIPGVRPEAFPIPFVVGFLEMLTRPGLFAIVNLYFYSIVRLREHKGLFIALFLILTNVLLSLRVGYKTELVLQGFLMGYYLFDLYDSMPKARRRLIAILTLLSIVTMLTLYPLMNVYRHKLLNEQDFSKAIARTGDAIQKETRSTFHSILGRINGIRAYYLTTKLGSNKTFHVGSLMNNNVPGLIMQELYGRDKDKAITAFGTTQLSVFYLIGGIPSLILGCLIIGTTIRWTTMFISNHVFSAPSSFEAYLPFFCILWVKVLAAGGGLPLYMKEFTLVLGCLYAMERMCYKRNLIPTNSELQNIDYGHEGNLKTPRSL